MTSTPFPKRQGLATLYYDQSEYAEGVMFTARISHPWMRSQSRSFRRPQGRNAAGTDAEPGRVPPVVPVGDP